MHTHPQGNGPAALETLHRHRLVSVIRAATPEAALAAANAVADGGIVLVEITYTVPDAPAVMAEIARRKDVVMGAGTVLQPRQVDAAIAAGAKFIIAPNFSPAVAAASVAAGVLYCPGAFTTTEIVAARDAGAHVVKVYPVGVVGGPDYIKIIRDPLPDIPLFAAGGTNLDNLVPFLDAGCVGIGLGAALADPGLAAAGRTDEITRRARAFVDKVASREAAGARR